MLNLLKRFRGRRDPREVAAQALYDSAVAQARRPEFYLGGGVPDSVDGRFEMVALHVYFILRRLKADDDGEAGIGQAVFDLMFVDMDQSLREMGVSDMSIGKRVKDMAKAFYGRLEAYDSGLADGQDALEAAIRRNIFGTLDEVPETLGAIANYIRAQAAHLDGQGLDELGRGKVTFLPWDAPGTL